MLTWIWIAVGVVVAIPVGLYAWGRSLPEAHRASVEEIVLAPPERVFDRIADFARYPEWRPQVKAVRVVDERRFIEEGSDRLPLRVVEIERPGRMVVAIDSDDLPFAGTWTYELADAAGGTRVHITEDGRVKAPMFRPLGRLFFPHDKTIREYLTALRDSFPR